MHRLTTLGTIASKYRIALQLGLLALGLLAVSLGGGAPECLPDLLGTC